MPSIPSGPNLLQLEVLYHDGPCIVVNKPTGIATQAPKGVSGLDDLVKEYLRQRESKTGNVYLGIPHRLDRSVSGAVVFARHVRAARRLSEQFQNRSVRKVYWALVETSDTLPALSKSGTWQDWLRKIPGRAAAEIVPPSHPDAKEAILAYRVLQEFHHQSCSSVIRQLEIELKTGRTHQIRVQAAARGMPILGDQQYGATTPFGPSTTDHRARAIALHARRLEFQNPKSRDEVSIEAPLWQSWEPFGLIDR